MSTALVAHVTKLYNQLTLENLLEKDIAGNYLKILDCANRLVNRAAELDVDKATPKSKPYKDRIKAIVDQVDNAEKPAGYKIGARLLVRETMRLLCAMRDICSTCSKAGQSRPNIHHVKVDEAVKLLHESFRAMINPNNPESLKLKELGIVISIGCGSWGEVFFEKHQGEDIELFLYDGIFSDLFCAFLNTHIVDKKGADADEADQMMAALLELTSIHPCAEQCVVFQPDAAEGEKDEVAAPAPAAAK